MVQKRLEIPFIGESTKFSATLITVNDRRNLFMKNPIDERKNRQTYPISKWNQNDSHEHY